MLAGVCLHTVPAFAATKTETDATVDCSNTDLLQTQFESFSGSYGNQDGGTEPLLRNGVAHTSSQYASPTPVVWSQTGNVWTWTLNTTVNTLGYDLSQVNLFHGHNDSGRDGQAVKVEYSKVATPDTYVTLYDMGGTQAAYASFYGKIGITAVPADGATGVKKIRITFNSVENGGGGVAEVDVLGTAQSSGQVSATGGNSTNDIGGYRIHTFTNSATASNFVVTAGGTVEYLVVGGGGGGGGGGSTYACGGGGGGGGVLSGTGFAVTPQAYSITVGAFGAGGAAYVSGSSGGDSSFSTLTAKGGSYGSGWAGPQTASGGGCGGGGGGVEGNGTGTGSSGTTGQGYGGGNRNPTDFFAGSQMASGGGGGAGGAGANATDHENAGGGGIGLQSSISGAAVTYAGGGGGGGFNTGGSGGSGIGGNGAGGHANGSSAGANTGGGGGGSGAVSSGGGTTGGDGGSGIVIIRYLLPIVWTNNAGGQFHTAANWNPNTVPGLTDNANFTNNAGYQVSWSASATNANAYYNPIGGSVTNAIGAYTWWLTNSFVLGQNAGKTASVVHASGTLAVTNAAGTAALIVGQTGSGRLSINGGRVLADRLYATNTSSQVSFSGGGSTAVVSMAYLGGTGLGGAGVVLNSSGTNVFSGPVALSNNTTVAATGGQLTFSGAITNAGWTLSVTNAAGATNVFNGGIAGAGGLIQNGAGTTLLTASNSYSGATTVSNGTLIVNGTNSGSGAVMVTNSATFGGMGAVTGAVTYASGSTGIFYKTTSSADTPLRLDGNLTLNSNTVTVDIAGSALGAGTYVLATNVGSGSISGSFATNPVITGSGLAGGASALITNNTKSVSLVVTSSVTGPGVTYNGAATNITTSSVYANGLMTAGGTANAYVYYGTSDGGSNTNNWASVSAPAGVSNGAFSIQLTGLASNTFYYYRIYLTNSSGYAWTGESYAWMAQIRTRNGWSLATLPIDFGPGSNTLNSAAGTNLMDNMHPDTDSADADNIWLQNTSAGWDYHWYNSASNAWTDEDSPPAISTESVQPGIGFWVKRADTGSDSVVSGLAGRPATNSAQLTLFATNWSVFGWPYAAATTTNGSGSTNIGWGFCYIPT